jgi:hypothetical protein
MWLQVPAQFEPGRGHVARRCQHSSDQAGGSGSRARQFSQAGGSGSRARQFSQAGGSGSRCQLSSDQAAGMWPQVLDSSSQAGGMWLAGASTVQTRPGACGSQVPAQFRPGRGHVARRC